MTVVEQLSLDGPRTLVDGRALKPRQERAWQLVRERPGITANEVGAILHADKGKHAATVVCSFCETDGRSVLTTQALRLLVIRRRGGLYEPRDQVERQQAVETTQPQGEDDGSFEAFMRGHTG